MKIVIAIITIFVLLWLGGVLMMLSEKYNFMKKPMEKTGKVIGSLGAIGCVGLIAIVIFAFTVGFIFTPSNEDNYDNTPSEWGPGVDNDGGGSPGYHNVDGYYRSDGTYVSPHIRSNPDGNPNNNLNP